MARIPWTRVRPFCIALAAATAIALTLFPILAGNEDDWGQFVLAPCIVAVGAIGVLGAIWPRWWTPSKVIVFTLLIGAFVFTKIREQESSPSAPSRLRHVDGSTWKS